MASDWKEFLAPSWKKAAIFVLAFITIFIVIHFPRSGCTFYNGAATCGTILPGTELGIVLNSAYVESYGILHLNASYIQLTILEIVVSYLLACALVPILAPKPAQLAKRKK